MLFLYVLYMLYILYLVYFIYCWGTHSLKSFLWCDAYIIYFNILWISPVVLVEASIHSSRAAQICARANWPPVVSRGLPWSPVVSHLFNTQSAPGLRRLRAKAPAFIIVYQLKTIKTCFRNFKMSKMLSFLKSKKMNYIYNFCCFVYFVYFVFCIYCWGPHSLTSFLWCDAYIINFKNLWKSWRCVGRGLDSLITGGPNLCTG